MHSVNMESSDMPSKALAFYGGAKGKYLLIHPSGRTSITDKNPISYGIKEDEDEDTDGSNVGMEGEGEEQEINNGTSGGGGSGVVGPPDESVAIGLPADNASVAEAKPVGIAIAGVGGVASSKPVATAVVGPGGLAVAKPVATAIAGVEGAESLVGVGGGKKKLEKPLKELAQLSNNSGKKSDEGSSRSAHQPVHSKRKRTDFGQYLRTTDDAKVIYVPFYKPYEYDNAGTTRGNKRY